MDDMFVARGRKSCKAQEITNLHHYQVELFYAILDMQIQELNSRFNETNTKLLVCLACLSPSESFYAFDKKKLMCLAQFYPKDFSLADIIILGCQLETYIMDIRYSVEFSNLNGISELAIMMVANKKDKVFPLVYLLLTLALILPVATATV
ncbi:hypothetical protein Ddye_019332 [Dipteronia dyeriana]|uniref:Uncharacterized protein n=1 Tax=Dipteronia dyeriana TaxID=168575 RepID=A0AAD9TXW2_9ROSI|nr:hypothetical protein Ddye_019332 [Dipteronia dyeriana]